ncbi:MAG: RNA-binding cell elongation regulator Jag/EloR [Lawsonibacter sp.]|nr:RNA-binding cell elongation regulator Jag/EloR [Lawsonibacter sp.]
MKKWIETTGRSEEDAISAALFQLGLDRDDVSIEVLERAKSGFLGFGSNPARVRVSYEVEEEGSTPKPVKDRMRDEVLSVVKEVPKPVRTPDPVAAPKPVSVEKKEIPVEKKKVPAVETTVSLVAEETILAAKPGAHSPRQRQQARMPERREPRPSYAQLQDGDEVLIGGDQGPIRREVVLVPADQEDEKAQKIGQFLTGLMKHLDVQAVPEVYITDEGAYKIILQGRNLGAIIGRRGETLDAIQQLTNYSVNHGQAKRIRVHIDAEGYRAKREDSLQRLAEKVAGKVVKYRKNMTLEAMNAYERHVIHTTLQDYPNVTTYSTGVEPNRRTVVAYAPGQK